MHPRLKPAAFLAGLISSGSLVLALSLVLLAGCGGHHHHATTGQRAYHTRYGVQAHSPTFGLPPKGVPLPKALPPSITSTVEQFDSTDPNALPSWSAAAAGYTSGFWPTYLPLTRRFPALARAHRVISIAVTHSFHAMCLDDEPLDATPAEAGPWVKADIQAGFWKPCVYASLSQMPAVISSIRAWLGTKWRTLVRLWDADWTFRAHVDAGYDCTQWTDHSQGNNDESTCLASFYQPVKPPPPPPLICFGKHANTANSTCRQVRARVADDRRRIASDNRASTESLKVFSGRHCGVFIGRVRWFTKHLNDPPRTAAKRASRRRAIAASARVYRERNCKFFSDRVLYFVGRVKTLSTDANALVRKYS